MECTVQRLLTDGERISGAFGYWRESGRFVLFTTRAVVLATGGVGQCWEITSNSWEYTGDGIAMALDAGADLIDMEMTQFHPTGMVWPPSVSGLLVTEGVRGDGGTLRNASGRRFMFDYVPDFFRAETADDEREADAWYDDKKNNRRTPDLLPRDEVARAINAEVKAGRGSPHGGVFLDIASRRDAEYVRRRLPSMYQQFKELADVDITKESMEVGPTLHYMMGGVRVEADTAATTVPGLFAAGEVAAGLHGANRLGGNSLSDLLVFGRRAGLSATEYARSCPGTPSVDAAELECTADAMLAPFKQDTAGDNPYTLHADLRKCMQNLVGIIRTESELLQAQEQIAQLRQRLERVSVQGNRQYNPAWHLALDLASMLTVSESITQAALERKESRGGHTRDDYPNTDAALGRLNVVTRRKDDGSKLMCVLEPLAEMPDELRAIVEDKTS
jgi:succinate dehydrogenase / fumarate reductase flavoprotein subunit